jgi:hypothetical protein
MKRFVIAVLATLAAAGGAHAQYGGVRGILGMGLTTGGDTLASIQYTDGSTDDIRAGGLVHVYGGLEVRLTPQVTMQGTIGYQVDETSSNSNGSLRFSRYPVELLAHVQISPNVRVGGGVRFVNDAKVSGGGVLSGVEIDYASTTGGVIEGEYLVTPSIGLKLRFVGEKYTPSAGGPSADGNHVGFYFNWYLW